MKFRSLAGLTLLALSPTLAFAGYAPDEVLVKFQAQESLRGRALAMTIGAHEVERSKMGVTRFRLPAHADVQAVVARFNMIPDVEYAEPNYTARTMFTPNDPRWSSQYGPKKIKADFGWDAIQGSPNVIIAILDTGVDLLHPDLATKLVPGYNFVSNNSNASDDHGHGTHCAGIAAAATNNAIGVAGVGFNSMLMPVKVLSSNGSGTHLGIANGITWATDQGAKVVSMSLGGTSASLTLENAVNYAWSKGVVVVAAAGNSNNSTKVYPAAYANVISVGSTDSSDNKSSFSNFGDWVDVAAPGTGILNTAKGGDYVQMSGTSMAAPHVAGQAALLWAYLGLQTVPSMIRDRIETTTDSVGAWLVNGRINVFESLQIGADRREHFVPRYVTVSTGTRLSGGVPELGLSDDMRYIVRSVLLSTGTSHRTTWWTKTTVTWQGQLQSLELRLESDLTNAGSVGLTLYNWATAKWNNISSESVAATEAVTFYAVTASPHAYVSSAGEVRARFTTTRTTTTAFTHSTDLLQVTTVAR